MKRALVLVVAISMILTGCFMGDEKTNAEISAGNHYLKGQVIALEACYSNATVAESTCVGVISYGDTKRSGRIMGEVQIGTYVYKECSNNGEVKCSDFWRTSVGETYMHGGEISYVQ